MSVAGVEPSEGFLKTATENLAGRTALHQGSATAIPLGDVSRCGGSGLVPNHLDQPAALLEMARVTGKGGMIAAYVWITRERWSSMRFFWDAAVELDPNAAKLDEGTRFLCRPEALEKPLPAPD